MNTLEKSAKIYDADEIIVAMKFLLEREQNYPDVKSYGAHPALAAQRIERIAFEKEQEAALVSFEAEQQGEEGFSVNSYYSFLQREVFIIQQAAVKNAFLHRQSLSYLGLNEDATADEEAARREAISLAYLAITVKNTLHLFIEELRAGKAGDWEYASIIKDLIAEPPVINFGTLGSNIFLKQYIAHIVLAETGLTREEAISLLHAQQALSHQTRVDKAKEGFMEAVRRIIDSKTGETDDNDVDTVFGEREPYLSNAGAIDEDWLVRVCGWPIRPEAAQQIREEVLAALNLTEEALAQYKPKEE